MPGALSTAYTVTKLPAQDLERAGSHVVIDETFSELWLDGAHNVAGAEAIAQTLAELEERAPKPVGLVVGMMGKKDAAGFLAHFRGLVRRVTIGSTAAFSLEQARGDARELLVEMARDKDPKAERRKARERDKTLAQWLDAYLTARKDLAERSRRGAQGFSHGGY